jgi:hypothetical protein
MLCPIKRKLKMISLKLMSKAMCMFYLTSLGYSKLMKVSRLMSRRKIIKTLASKI